MQQSEFLSMCASLERVINSIMSFVDTDLEKGVIDIPDIKDPTQLSTLYGGYKETAVNYQEACNKLALLVQAQIKLRQLRKSIREEAVLPSIRSKITAQIEFLLSQVDLVREATLTLKSKYEKLLQFYNSSQYLISNSTYKI